MRSRLILASTIIGILFIGTFSAVFAYSENISVSAGSVKTKSVYLEKGDTIRYGLTVNGGQNDDIYFTINDPSGFHKLTDTVYSYQRSSFIAEKSGNYKFVFKNKMSYVSYKCISFDWQITKPTLGVTHSDTSGYVVNSAGWFYILVIVGIIGTIIAAVAASKRKKPKNQDNSKSSGSKDNKPSVDPPKISSNKICFHTTTHVREDRMEVCNKCDKELGKLLGNGKESESKEETKPIQDQQNLDSYVAQSKLDDSLEKETIHDIERNEEALGLLKERLAKGEISVKVFQEIKNELS